MTDDKTPEQPPCPECGKVAHNPKTGYCWKSTQRPPKGWHCKFCCVNNNRLERA